MNFAATNNIRFFDTTLEANFSTRFPNFDNQLIGKQYYNDREFQDYIREHLINNQILLQYRSTTSLDQVEVYKNDVLLTTITTTIINPTGWTGNDVYKIAYTPTTAGVYYFVIKTTNYKSDEFNVVNTFTKDVVKLTYNNKINDYGTVFVNASLLNIYKPICFFNGYLNQGKMKIDKEVFTADRGNSTTIRSTPMGAFELHLELVHETYLEYLLHIFACSELKVNDIEVNTDGDMSIEQIPESDCYNVTIPLIRRNTAYLK